MISITPQYRCDECGELHDSYEEAKECFLDCIGIEVSEVYLCPLCDKEHIEEENAIDCCGYDGTQERRTSHKELEANGQERLPL